MRARAVSGSRRNRPRRRRSGEPPRWPRTAGPPCAAASARRRRAGAAPELELEAELAGEAPAGLLDPRDASAPSRQMRRAPTSSAVEVAHLAVLAHRDLRRAAADVDVHDGGLVADRSRHGARAVGRHHRLQAVAGATATNLPACARTVRRSCAHCAGAPRRRSGSARRCRSRPGRPRVGVLPVDEGAERLGVDGLLGA